MIPQRTAKVIPLRPRAGIQISAPEHPSPFDKLTVTLILDQHRRGVLPEALLVMLLAGVGLRP
jgi:hypothetical protein